MKLSRLYSNKPDLFEPVDFVSGLNVVMAEIRMPENRNKDTHNLGKSTLGRILDFCFLVGKNKNFFLFKHFDLFKDFVFFFEIELMDASYVTVRRGVKKATRINFKKHEARLQDFTEIPESEWDHVDMPFDRAREMLDSLLDWRALKPWSYRKGIGYLLRSQEDYRDVFQLRKFAGILLLKQEEAEKKQEFLDAFDFRLQDEGQTKQLVDEVDVRIADLNAERYSLNKANKKIRSSLEDDQILFDPADAQRLFDEAGVLFQGQIKKDYQQLIAFNRAITAERRAYLLEELTEIESKLKAVNEELNTLGKKRSDLLSFLSSTDVFNKYKEVSNEIVSLRADITSLERQRGFLHRLQELRAEIRTLKEDLVQCKA